MLRRSLPVWLVLVCVAGPPARAQLPFARDLIPGRTPLERTGLERTWFSVIPLIGSERLVQISRTSDLLFAQTSLARLHTIDPETGRILWSAEMGGRTGFAAGTAANTWAVFATSANTLYGLDRGTGRMLWKVDLGTLPSSTPACDDSRVLVGMSDGMMKAFRLKYLDNKGSEHIYDKPIPLWSYHAGKAITTRPLPAEKLVAFGGGDHKAWVVLADDPTVIYRFTTGGAIGEGLGAYGARTLLIPSADKLLYATDLVTAKPLWNFPSGAPIEQAPLVAGEDIYVINTEGSLSSLDPKTGEPRWTISTQGGQLIAVSPTKVYLRSYNLDLFVVDRVTGRIVIDPAASHLRAGLNLREYPLYLVNRFNDRMYLGTRSGLILALREIGQVRPQLLRDPKQPPFGFIPPEGIELNPPPPPETPAENTTPEPAADAANPAGGEAKPQS